MALRRREVGGLAIGVFPTPFGGLDDWGQGFNLPPSFLN